MESEIPAWAIAAASAIATMLGIVGIAMSVVSKQGMYRGKFEAIVESHAEKIKSNDRNVQELSDKLAELRGRLTTYQEMFKMIRDDIERVREERDKTHTLANSIQSRMMDIENEINSELAVLKDRSERSDRSYPPGVSPR